jgi:NADH-quinone oxidoreductase subunit J
MVSAATFFYIFAALSLIFALLVVTRQNAVHSAICLIITFFFMAAVYVILKAELLAAIQVLVYAGGVVGLMLYVIMLVKGEEANQAKQHLGQKVVAAFVALLLFLQLASVVYLVLSGKTAGMVAAEAAKYGGNTEGIGALLYTKYLFPFEVASVLLLAAMVGAIVLAKNRLER